MHVKFSGELNYIYIIGFLKDFFLIDEIKVILAHEIAHAKKKHTVKLSIIGKISSALALILSSIIIMYYDSLPFPYAGSSFPILQLILTLLTTSLLLLLIPTLVTCYFARKMELEADMEAAKLCGIDICIRTLRKLDSFSRRYATSTRRIPLMSTHLSIEKRVEKLQNKLL